MANRFGDRARARRELFADTSRATPEQLAADPILAADRRFNDNFAAIKAERDRTSNKSWERAYKVVTGLDWPKGFDIKINPTGIGGWIQKDPEVMKKALRNAAIAGAATVGLGTALTAAPGVLPSTTIGPGYVGPIAGQTGLSAADVAAATALPSTQIGTGAVAGMGNLAAVGGGSTGAAVSGAGGAGGVAPSTAAAPGVAPSAPAFKATTSWLAPFLEVGLPVAGQVAGTIIATRGNTAAAKEQAKSTAAALDFEKKAYADMVSRLSPYIASGASSNERQARVLGLNATPQPSGAVRMKAPDGSVEWVPRGDVEMYKAHGAQVVL